MKNIITIIIAILSAVGVFFLLRSCNPPTPVVVDRLATNAHELKKVADSAYNQGLSMQKEKVVIRTVYRQDTAANHRYKKRVKDSLIKVMLHVPQRDTSEFTFEAADEILDMGSLVKKLRSEGVVDSLTIENLVTGYTTLEQSNTKLDSAVCACRKEVTTLEKKVKRKNILIALSALGGFLLGKL